MTYETLDLQQNKNVMTITLNRPGIHNAFDPVLIRELRECFERLSGNDSIRVIILTGSGKSFCAGANLNWMKAMSSASFDENQRDAFDMARLFQTLDTCPKPIVGRINGATFGGGMGLVSICDVVIAVDSAKFAFTEVKLGLIPAVISSFVLRKIGPSQSRALFVTGERFSAERALAIGLVHEICPVDVLDDKVNETVRELLTSAPGAIAAAKVLIAQQTWPDAWTQLKINVRDIAERRASAEGQEGINAFLEKRPPAWV